MEFWEDLSGGAKGMILVGVLLAILMGTYNACSSSEPSETEIQENEAKRRVN